VFLASFFTPLHDLWWLIFGQSQAWLLNLLYHQFQSVPPFSTIGAYGLAIIVLTILLRILLAPLQQWQQHLQRKTQAEQRIIAPRLAELRRQYKGDPKGFNDAMMALYREHGINPFAGLATILPLLIQLPILIALFWVFRDFAHSATVAAHFLFIPNLNDSPLAHRLLPYVPTPAYIALPLLAALTTYLQARLSLAPPAKDAATLERSTHRTQQIVGFVVPVIVYFTAITVPAGLGLYWFISNLLAVLQQQVFKSKSSSTKA
jgi:YidC/Oxa1 family membrane protein insertase